MRIQATNGPYCHEFVASESGGISETYELEYTLTIYYARMLASIEYYQCLTLAEFDNEVYKRVNGHIDSMVELAKDLEPGQFAKNLILRVNYVPFPVNLFFFRHVGTHSLSPCLSETLNYVNEVLPVKHFFP